MNRPGRAPRRRRFASLVALVVALSAGLARGQDDGAAALEALAARDRATRERALGDVRARLFQPDAFEAMLTRVDRVGPEARLRLQDAVVATPECVPIVLELARTAPPAERELARSLLRAALIAEWARREPPPSKKPGNDPPFEEGTQVGLEWPLGASVSWTVALTWLEQTAPGRRGVAFHPRVLDATARRLEAHQFARSTASGLLARLMDGSDLVTVDAGLVLLLERRLNDPNAAPAATEEQDDDERDPTRGVQLCLEALLAGDVEAERVAAVAIALRIRGAENVAARAFIARPQSALLRAMGAGAEPAASSVALVEAVLSRGSEDERVRLATRFARDPDWTRALVAEGVGAALEPLAAARFRHACAFAAAAARPAQSSAIWADAARTAVDAESRIDALRVLVELDPRAPELPALAATVFARGMPSASVRTAVEASWILQCANEKALDTALLASWSANQRAVSALRWPFDRSVPLWDARDEAIAWTAAARRDVATASSFRSGPRWTAILANPALHPLIAEGFCAAVPGLGRASRFHVDQIPSPMRALWIETLRLATLDEVADEDQTFASRLALELAPLRGSDPVARRVAAELRSVIYESPRVGRRVTWNYATVFSPR